MNVLTMMRRSHALRFVPGWNRPEAATAFANVSCTRSSASGAFPSSGALTDTTPARNPEHIFGPHPVPGYRHSRLQIVTFRFFPARHTVGAGPHGLPSR